MSETFMRTEIHFVNTTFTPEPRTFMATVESGTDIEGARAMMSAMVNSGWEIGAVHAVTDQDYDGEFTVMDYDTVDDIIDVTEHLLENEYDATRILGYAETHGWDADNILSGMYEDPIYFTGDDREDVAREWFYELNEELMNKIGEAIYLSIDWEHTADQMDMDGMIFHNRNGIHMVFSV